MKKHATTRKGRIGGLRIASVIALVLLVMVCAISCPEPNNTPKGNATLYITGNYMTADSADPPNYTHHVGYWVVNGTGTPAWNEISDNFGTTIMDLVVSNNTVYIGGYTNDSSTNTQTAGYWKIENSNTTSPQWKALQKLDADKDSNITAITVAGDKLYAIGSSIDSNGDTVYGYWTVDLVTEIDLWTQLTLPPDMNFPQLSSVAISSDTLYIGASITDSTSYVSQPGYWSVDTNTNASTWKNLPRIDGDAHSYINDLIVSGDTVYATGVAGLSPSGEVASYWKVVGSGNPTRYSVSDPMTQLNADATCIAISGSTAYIAGSYSDAGGNEYTCYWTDNGTGPAVTNTLPVYNHASPKAIAQKDGMLYIAGYNYNGTDTIPGYWIVDTTKNSKTWVSLSTDSGDVTSMFLVP